MLRNVLDGHSKTIQTVQLQRSRNYDDELQHFDHPNPEDAPQWTFNEQYDMIYDTDIDKATDVDVEEDFGDDEQLE